MLVSLLRCLHTLDEFRLTDGSRRVRENSSERLTKLIFFARLLLGGGYGWLSGEHGLVIDNLVKVLQWSTFSLALYLSRHRRQRWLQQMARLSMRTIM